VLHSFSAGVAEAERIIEMGFYVGITGPITYRNGEQMRAVAAAVPLDRLLIETDSPYLSPQPQRGRRNEPAHVRAVAEKIAELRALPLPVVADATTANAGALFGWEHNREHNV
jgi:TatD DNase family protein